MYGGDWGEVHDNDVTLGRRDSAICMDMTIEEDMPPQYFDYVQGQYHMPLENQAVSYPPVDNYYGGNDCWTTPEYVQGEYHMLLENQALSCPPADNYYGGNDNTRVDIGKPIPGTQLRERGLPNVPGVQVPGTFPGCPQ